MEVGDGMMMMMMMMWEGEGEGRGWGGEVLRSSSTSLKDVAHPPTHTHITYKCSFFLFLFFYVKIKILTFKKTTKKTENERISQVFGSELRITVHYGSRDGSLLQS